MFSLNLLGPVTADMNGSPFAHFGTARGQALFIYLALENDYAHGREAIMHLMWPGMPLKSAQGNLRQTIYLLRKAFQDAGIAESPILSTRQTVQRNPNFPLSVDVHQFEIFINTGTLESRQARQLPELVWHQPRFKKSGNKRPKPIPSKKLRPFTKNSLLQAGTIPHPRGSGADHH